MAMGTAIVAGVSAIAGGIAQSKAAKKAAGAAKRARRGFAPYMQLGQYGAEQVRELMEEPESFTGSPGYQLRFGEGQRAVERSAASRGKMFSGQLLKELTTYGQGMASQEYQSEFQRRMSMANLGGQAASGAVGAAQLLGQAYRQQGQAQAGMYQGIGKAMSFGMGQMGQTKTGMFG